ncbi:MAG: hypothetical protein Q4G58_08230 [bacterium]|nr:hypothetical protein [bacterium]
MQWINPNGLIIICIMMIPNIIFGMRHNDLVNLCKNQFMNIIEQIGRYGTFFLMIFNIGIFEEGPSSEVIFYIWLGVAYLLLLIYMACWAVYFNKGADKLPMTLAIVPIVLFLMTGILLRHYLLIVFSVIFGIGHIYVTWANNKNN